MKHKSSFRVISLMYLAFLLFTLNAQPSFAQNCDKCSCPTLALYDSDVQIVRPTSSDSIISWYNLFWASAAARGYMHTNDPTKDCIRWLDGALVNAVDLQGGVLKFGSTYANLPPNGPIKSSDYLIRSTVIASQGSYIFTLILETAETREVVKSASSQFNATLESANQAGQNAASELMPLFQTIRQFEVNKRNSDVKVAIRDYWDKNSPDDIIIKPEKTNIDTGETINIDITMIDCDGVPLSNREVIFNDTTIYWNDSSVVMPINGTRGGKITPRIAITDESGNVTVKFKAADTAGIAEIVASYPHFKPCGKASVFQGTAIVKIKAPVQKLWLFKATVTEELTMSQDTIRNYTISNYSQRLVSSNFIDRQTIGKVTALIENLAEDSVNDFSFHSDFAEPKALTFSGSGWYDEYSKNSETIDGTLISAEIRNDNVSGIASGAGIDFDYSNDYKYMGVGVSIFAPGAYHIHRYGYDGSYWDDYYGKYDNYGLDATAGFDGNNINGIIIKTDSGYSGTWEFTDSVKEYSSDGIKYTTNHKTLNVTVVPYNSLTAVNNEKQINWLPKEFSLSQNYPNPFNPNTIINYSVPKTSLVTIKVYSVLGKEIETLVNEEKGTGTYKLNWNATNLPSGVYFYKLKAGEFIQTKKMILLK